MSQALPSNYGSSESLTVTIMAVMAIASAFMQKVIAEPKLRLRVGDGVVAPADRVRNLGVILDSKMSMRQQINSVTSSAYYHIRAIGRIRRNLDSDVE